MAISCKGQQVHDGSHQPVPPIGGTVPVELRSAASRALAFTRYFFISRLVCMNQSYSLQTPPLFGHPASLLHRTHFCAIYCLPSTTSYCNIYYTLLVMAISYKGQAVPRQPRSSYPWANPFAASLTTQLIVSFLVQLRGYSHHPTAPLALYHYPTPTC